MLLPVGFKEVLVEVVKGRRRRLRKFGIWVLVKAMRRKVRDRRMRVRGEISRVGFVVSKRKVGIDIRSCGDGCQYI